MIRLILPFLCLFLAQTRFVAQTFTTIPGEPVRDEAPLISSLVVSGLPDHIGQENFGVELVCLNLRYWDIDHLIITLYAPDGTMVKLTHLNGRDNADELNHTCFGENGNYFPLEHPPYNNVYQPVIPLGVVNNGQNPNGVWRLLIEEYDGEAYEGILDRWSITFGAEPAVPNVSLESSDLPILAINTFGQHIRDEPKINAQMGIVYQPAGGRNHLSDPFNGYNGAIGIEWHGSSSKTFWQQSYGVETRDAAGDDLDASLCGMPPGADWVLHGPFSDKSLLRNALTLCLADEASDDYVPRARFCELVLNGSYLGVYTLMEKIKRGAARVDVARLRKSDLSGDALTGGYIVKVDRRDSDSWHSRFRPAGGGKVYFNYVYPKAEDIQPAQKAYIQAYIDSFERALLLPEWEDPALGWRRFADENSFIEHFIFNEVCKNVDAYRLSGHLYKQRDSEGGRLFAGPLWDFNLAWRNANYVNNELPTGWTFQGEKYGVPFWWERLLEDAVYAEHLQCRWFELRQTVLSQRHIFSVIDSLSALLEESRIRHYELYPIMGRGLWPNPKPIAKTYEAEISNMKYWISERLHWMDAYLPGACEARPYRWQPLAWVVFPNPAHDELYIFFDVAPEQGATLELTDITGRRIEISSINGFEATFDLRALQNGLYILVYRNKEEKILHFEKIVKM